MMVNVPRVSPGFEYLEGSRFWWDGTMPENNQDNGETWRQSAMNQPIQGVPNFDIHPCGKKTTGGLISLRFMGWFSIKTPRGDYTTLNFPQPQKYRIQKKCECQTLDVAIPTFDLEG